MKKLIFVSIISLFIPAMFFAQEGEDKRIVLEIADKFLRQ